jgi:hypothetical protein
MGWATYWAFFSQRHPDPDTANVKPATWQPHRGVGAA